MISIAEEKQFLRKIICAKRAERKAFQLQKNDKLVRNLLDFTISSCSVNQVIAVFWPLENEPDLRSFANELYGQGYIVCLPETMKKIEPLRFRVWSPHALMKSGKYGTVYPDTEIILPDWIFLPLLAFDRFGNRLGYGGGYYDRTLQTLPDVKTIGVAFSYQEVEKIPIEAFDCPLSTIITEKEVIYRQKE